ncbi:hypothetical protein KJ980_07225 [Patescibacteria group bacterium]|nr:hypothetical protein [Patescibacteria group bacterium]MBU4016965.1 hypothetical protein [Patescibacteria group bacterium]MBU4099412.1 hypothetical protein [Patescibacteria group bacterium]
MTKEKGSFINFKKDVPLEIVRNLKEGVMLIRACIGTRKQYKQTNPTLYKQIFEDIEWNATHDVSLYGGSIYENKKSKYASEQSYIISPLDENNKASNLYNDCTGILLIGQDKITGNNISLLSHQNPRYFLINQDNKNTFKHGLDLALEEAKKRCFEGTIDIVIFGGNYLKENALSQNNYINSVNLLNEEVKKVLGFEPFVITGPKTNDDKGYKDDVFYDNSNQRFYIMRGQVGDASAESYFPSKIEEQKKRW